MPDLAIQPGMPFPIIALLCALPLSEQFVKPTGLIFTYVTKTRACANICFASAHKGTFTYTQRLDIEEENDVE